MMNREPQRHTRRRSERTKAILILVLLCAAVIAGASWGVQTYRRQRAEDKFAELAESTWESGEGHSEGPVPETPEPTVDPVDPIQKLQDMGVPIPEKEVDVKALQEETNPDIYAWLYIPDSSIDYPVLQHPTDNSYYLNYNIDGSKGYPGCIYTENYNRKDFSDPNTVMYGHNMKNGSMFADLHKFEDSEYFSEHPYIYVYTEEGLLVYRVFAAHQTSNEHILYSCDFSDGDSYERYLEGIFESRGMNDNIAEDVEVTRNDRILTLSTCVSNKPERRYLVQGVLLNEAE